MDDAGAWEGGAGGPWLMNCADARALPFIILFEARNIFIIF